MENRKLTPRRIHTAMSSLRGQMLFTNSHRRQQPTLQRTCRTKLSNSRMNGTKHLVSHDSFNHASCRKQLQVEKVEKVPFLVHGETRFHDIALG